MKTFDNRSTKRPNSLLKLNGREREKKQRLKLNVQWKCEMKAKSKKGFAKR